jgi:RNA polymerase sigma factor (sigma-70 family)
MGSITLDQDSVVASAYALHANLVRRGLISSTRDPGAAEDLTQEAFIRLVIEVRAGRTPDNIRGWLQRVAYNLAMSRGRHLAVADRRSAELASPAFAPSPEGLMLDAERDDALRDVLAALGSVDRRALILASQGYPVQEIAQSIGRSNGATRTLMCRARMKLRIVMLDANSPSPGAANRPRSSRLPRRPIQ